MSRILFNEIKSMLELRLTPEQIAHRIRVPVESVNLVIATLKKC